jgi:autotransporter-associated beta strand protein
MINLIKIVSRISIVLLLLATKNFSFSQTSVYWRTDGPSDGKWLWGSTCESSGDGQWFYNAWGGFRQAPDCFGNHNIFFDGNGINTMNLNSRDFGFQTLTFTANATTARTLNADGTLRLFLNNSSGTPKIENLSGTGHTINAPLTFNALSELNPVNGDLSFQAINNNGNELNVWGDNSKNINFNGVISGTGKFILKQYSIAKFGASHTYTGNTEIDKGELWIESAGGISSSSAIFLGNGGQMGSVAKFWLSNLTGGTTFARNITVNDGNANTRYIGGINTSGTNTYSGNITNNSSTGGLILQSVSAGGNTNFSGVLSGSSYIVEGPGTVTISGASDNTFTGTMTVNSGTLVLNKTAGIKAIPQLPSAITINNGAIVRTDAANQFGSGAMPCLITMNGNAVFNGNNTNQKIAVVSGSSTSSITMGSGTLTIDNTSVDTYAGTISGTGGLIKTNTGTQIFTNTGINYSGNTTITQGVLQLGAAGVIPNSSNFIMNGGTFSTGSGAGFSETVGTLTVNANSTIALGTGAHNLNFANSNAASWTTNTFLTITGWTGGFNGTTGTAGKIFIGSDASGLTMVQLQQVFFVNGSNYHTATILSTGEIVPTAQVALFWGGISTDNWASSKWGQTPSGPYTTAWANGRTAIFHLASSQLTGAGSNTSSVISFENATITTTGGTLGTAGQNMVIDVKNGKTFDFSTNSFSSSATFGITKNGSGTIALAGNTYGGGFTLNSGIAIARGVNAFGGNATPGTLTINGGTIAANAARDFSSKYSSIIIGGDFTLGSSTSPASGSANLTFSNATSLGSSVTRAITLGGTGTYTWNGIISGTSSNLTLNATAAGILALGGANTYGGNTTINGGTLAITGANRLPTGTNLIFANTSGAIFNLNANNQTVASLSGGGVNGGNLSGSGILTVNQSTNTTYSGRITGTVKLTKTGTGILTIAHSSNNSTGVTTITAGELRLNPTANATFASQIDLNGGKLSTNSIASSRTITNSSTLKLSASSSIDLGSNVHSISFAASNAIAWTAGQTLTINGWTGTEGNSGTAGRIFVGSAATHLTSAQLDQITFTGFDPGAMLLSNGELVPREVICTVAPTSLLISTATICNGSSITLTQSGGTLGTGATWRWYSDASFSTLVGSSSSANASLVLSPTTSTTYYLRAEGNFSPCSSNLAAPGNISVTVNQPSVAPSSLNGTATICDGSSTNLTQTGGSLGTGAIWRWYSNSGFTTLIGSSSDANANLSVSPTSTTTYWLRAEGTTSPCTENVAAGGSVTITVLPEVNYGTVDEGHVVISQVYGGGGLAGASHRNDFVELYNPTSVSVSLSTFSIQYASKTGTSWSKQDLTGSIEPHSYYLIQLFSGGANGDVLPTPDNTGTIDMANDEGKIALISNQTTITAGNSCPTSVIDFVGYGSTTNCSEGSPVSPNLSRILAAFRKNNGCTETNNNSNDFSVATPNPRNSSSSTNNCGLNQSLCDSGIPNPMSVTGSEGSSSFTYQWYYQDGIVAAPTGTSTTGWTSLGSSDGANTRLYEPSTSLTASRTYACFVTPTGSPTCGESTWADGAKQVTINLLPTASAGTTINSFVGEYETIAGASATNGTILWTSDGTGIFDETWFTVGNDETVSPTYYVDEGDFGQTVTLTMTVTGLGACSSNTASDDVVINVSGEPGLWHYQCGTTTPYIDEYIYIYAVPGATNYRIRIDDGVNTPEIREQTSTVFFFRQFTSAEYNTTYECDVDAFVGGDWVGYGPVCEVTTPDIPVTKVQASQCGTTLATVNSTIFADNVWGVELYEFSCFDGVTTQTFQTPNRYFNLTQLASYAYSTTYQITVRTRTNGIWTAFGASCNLTTPAQVCEIIASQCGIILTDNNTDIYCNSIPNTTIYEFKLVNGGTTLTIQKPSRTFKFSQVSGIIPGVMYAVSVRTFTDGTWSSFGSSCNITSSSTLASIDPSYCNITLTDNNTDIYCLFVPSTTIYEFRLVNGGTTLTIQKPSRTFKFSQISGILPGVMYAVSVRTFTNDSWTDFGSSCNITSASSLTKIIASQCSSTLTNISTDLYADAVLGATQYRFRVTNSGGTLTIDKASRTFKLSQLANAKYDEVNTIDVNAYVNGAWIGYGSTCEVTTPALPTTKLMTSQCGITLSSTTEYLYADPIFGANQYRFRVINTGLSYNQTITKTGRFFRMSEMSGLTINTTYEVDVAVYINGAWQDYGTICEITTPPILAMPTYEDNMLTQFVDFDFQENDSIKAIETSLSLNEFEFENFEMYAFPNPFINYFNLKISLNENDKVIIKVTDLTGKIVEEIQADSYNISKINLGENYQKGMYHLSIFNGTQTNLIKVIKN